MMHPAFVQKTVLALFFLATAGCVVDAQPTQPIPIGDDPLPNDAANGMDSDDQSAETGEQRSGGGLLVSPELFELSARWSADSDKVAPDERVGLETYAKQYAPELAREAAAAMARSTQAITIGPVIERPPCSCQVWGTYDKPSTVLTGSASATWTVAVRGAAHSGGISQEGSHMLKETTSDSAIYKTQFKTRLNCTQLTQPTACTAGCTGKLYADVRYASQLRAAAWTGGIWSKGATAQAVDAVTLDLHTPFAGTSTRLFEKGASISHFATTTTYDPNALATLVQSGLVIGTAIATGDVSLIGPSLTSDTVTAFFGLIHRSGANGETSQGFAVDYETAFAQPIVVGYASTQDQYYALDLASSVALKTRGYGGSHLAESSMVSGYSMAVYLNNFVCAKGVTPPPFTGFWRYDTYSGAPITTAAAQDRVKNFFYLATGTWVNVSAQEGAL